MTKTALWWLRSLRVSHPSEAPKENPPSWEFSPGKPTSVPGIPFFCVPSGAVLLDKRREHWTGSSTGRMGPLLRGFPEGPRPWEESQHIHLPAAPGIQLASVAVCS